MGMHLIESVMFTFLDPTGHLHCTSRRGVDAGGGAVSGLG